MARKQKMYLMHPIYKQNKEDVLDWYRKTINKLKDNYDIYTPLLDIILTDTKERLSDPVVSDSAIVSRDLHYASDADILFVDFTGSDITSIGCCFELAVGYWNHRHIVAVLPEDNVHNHSFIRQVCSIT